jgi:hypothetical protein
VAGSGGGGSSSGTTTFGFEVIYSVTTNAIVGQPITTDNYTKIHRINPLSGFPSLPDNILVDFDNVHVVPLRGGTRPRVSIPPL